MTHSMTSSMGSVASILAAMAVVALLETAAPLRARNGWSRLHLVPNLALTGVTFATNLVLSAMLVILLAWLELAGLGLFNVIEVGASWAGLIAIAALDFAFYLAHVAMHRVPLFWRFHSVHHSDPAVDVTTSLRQHPVEGVIRYAFIALFAAPLGVSPGAFAIYRSWSAINALFEHANLRIPLWLDALLSFVTTWPNMHKVHHSRRALETDSNYGNIFSFWDRMLGTYTPSRRGLEVDYGLDGHDAPARQTIGALLAGPFRIGRRGSASAFTRSFERG